MIVKPANRHLLNLPNDLYAVASPTDPRAVEAAEQFGPWMLGSVRDFAEKVGPYLK